MRVVEGIERRQNGVTFDNWTSPDLGGSKGFLRAGEMKEIYLIVELMSNRETKQKRSFHTVGLSCVKTRGHTMESHIYHNLIECIGMMGTCVCRLGTLRR